MHTCVQHHMYVCMYYHVYILHTYSYKHVVNRTANAYLCIQSDGVRGVVKSHAHHRLPRFTVAYGV
jgi:hypothetical protein